MDLEQTALQVSITWIISSFFSIESLMLQSKFQFLKRQRVKLPTWDPTIVPSNYLVLKIETFTQHNLAVIHTSSLTTTLNTAVLDSGIWLLSRFYFPLIFHFFDGSLDSFLITQKLVRAQRVQILIKFKKYGHTSGEGDIDDVLIGDACQRKTKQSYTSSFLIALFLRLTSLKTVKDTFQPPLISPATQRSDPS